MSETIRIYNLCVAIPLKHNNVTWSSIKQGGINTHQLDREPIADIEFHYANKFIKSN
jgi:hypothetical protein